MSYISRRFKSLFMLLRNNLQFISDIRKNGGRIQKGVTIRIHGTASVGEDVVIGGSGIDLFNRTQIVLTPGANLIIGNHVGMTSVSIFCKKSIYIGDYVNIGAGTMIIDSNFHSTDWKMRENRIEDVKSAIDSPIKIDHHVFIGARCIIMKGVTIGSRSIISAGSVVTRDIPSDCIAAGNPCVIIKKIKN